MTRAAPLIVLGCTVLVSLTGCGRGFFQTAEREPWRAEAEVACLKSGAVKETAELERIAPISGPGICGAEFPLKVAALGESNGTVGFADEVRTPAGLNGQPRWPLNQQGASASTASSSTSPPSYPSSPGATSRYPQSGGPMSLNAPGVEPENDEIELPPDGMPGVRPIDRPPPSYEPPLRNPPSYSQQRLGPAQGMPISAFGPVELKPVATLACPIVSVLDRWLAESVQPAAVRWFGARVVEIKQISAYSCRGMNGNPNAHISEHAFGNAIDIAGFTLADGRRISVKDGWKGLPEEQGFLRDVQGSACQNFNTVLAPGSNVYHYDHIHVDLMRRASGRIICQPAAVSGDEVAARASSRSYSRDNGARDAGVTGSITLGGHHKSSGLKKKVIDDDDWVEDESSIKDRD